MHVAQAVCLELAQLNCKGFSRFASVPPFASMRAHRAAAAVLRNAKMNSHPVDSTVKVYFSVNLPLMWSEI